MSLSHAGRFTYENDKADAAAAAAASPAEVPEPGEATEPEPTAKAGPWSAVNPATEKTAAARPARSTT